MQLVEVDSLQPQPPQTRLAGTAQARRPAVGTHLVRACALQPTLRGDHQVVRVGVQRFGNETLAHARPVGVGRVDQVYAQLDRTP